MGKTIQKISNKMKHLITILLILFSISVVAQDLNGAWVSEEEGHKEVMIITDGYFSISTFKANEFIETEGGMVKNIRWIHEPDFRISYRTT